MYNLWGDEMEDGKKIKVDCNLITRGTIRADSSATDDLAIPDPDPVVGEKIIKEAIKEENKDDDQSATS